MTKGKRLPVSESPWLVKSLIAVMVVTSAFISLQIWQGRSRNGLGVKDDISAGCSFSSSPSSGTGLPGHVSRALVHYATSRILPQQNRGEIELTLKVLSMRSPCNFLVFGLGHDSALWNALNADGNTVFLEEDSNWLREIVKSQPGMKAHHVQYRTRMSKADALLRKYRTSRTSACRPTQPLKTSKCELALTNLPALIYDTEWDVIMIDAPRGFFDAAPGRMSAIFTAAVMARNRNNEGPTDIFVHDIDRRVEKMYAEEFLCKRNLVGSSGRLWHFRVPTLFNAAPLTTSTGNTTDFFCV